MLLNLDIIHSTSISSEIHYSKMYVTRTYTEIKAMLRSVLLQ